MRQRISCFNYANTLSFFNTLYLLWYFIYLHDSFHRIPSLGYSFFLLLTWAPQIDPKMSRVRQPEKESDDEEVEVHGAADHRGSAGAGGRVATAEVCRRHGISSATFFKWKAKYDVSDARKLKALEDENAKLKKLLAEAMLDITMLKELNAKKW